MRRIKRLVCVGLAALMIFGGALAEDSGAEEAVLQAQEQAEKEAAERAAAEKEAAEKEAAEKAAAEKEAAEKAAVEKAAAEKEAAEKAAAEKAAAEKEAAEKAAVEKAAAEKEAAEKEAAEKEAAEKAAAEKEAAEKETAEKAASEKAAAEKAVATEENSQAQENDSSDDSTDKPSATPSEAPSGNGEDNSPDSTTDMTDELPSVTPSDNPTDTPAEDPTDTPADVPSDTPAADPTGTPSDNSTDAPMVDPTATPAATPTAAPSIDPTSAPTETPAETPTPEPTPEPTPTPTPEPTQTVGEIAISVTPSEGLTLDNGAYQVSPKQASTLTLTWSCSRECDGYSLNLTRDKDVLYSGSQSESTYVIDLASLQSGSYTFVVEATVNGDVVARGQYAFAVTTSEGVPKGGRSGFGGGHGGGSRSGGGSGGKSSGGEGAEEEQGFRVTPGTALTSTHTSGTKDMRLYGAVELAVSQEPMTRLTLGGEVLDIGLEGGGAFTASIEEDRLVLTAEGGELWRLNGLALKRLYNSGIETIVLKSNDWQGELAADQALQGEVYARLRAEGVPSSDFRYAVSSEGIRVTVNGETYRLDDENVLTPMEGD